MVFKLAVFFALCHQSICYVQQSGCSNSTFNKFTKCPTRTYCGITDTGAYECLPCPAGKLCPGDGYTYPVQQLNNMGLTAKYITNGSYIVSSNSSNRVLFRKKFKKIIKIAKVGLKVAIIAKTGGVAGLKMAAAQKIKEIAMKKGLQCLKNGFSNFCNGKKKLAKLGAIKKIKSNLRGKLGSKGVVVSKTKLRPLKNAKNSKKISNPSSRTKKRQVVTKPTSRRPKGKTPSKKRVKRVGTNPPSKSSDKPCSNIFDSFANKVNNVTRHVADNAVNKGRDWLKKNVGGNTGNCKPGPVAKQPTNLRGSKRGIEKSSSGANTDTDDSPNNSNADDGSALVPTTTPNARPNARIRPSNRKQPVIKTDDTTVTSTSRPARRRPVIKTDDSTVTSNPTSRPVRKSTPIIRTDDTTVTNTPTSRPVRKRRNPVIKTDDSTVTSNPTSTPVRTRSRPIRTTRIPISRPTIRPTFIVTVGPTSAPASRRPSSRPTIRPTRLPSAPPTRIPSARPSPNPSARPSPMPSARPSPNPSPKPSARPSVKPTFIPTEIAGPPTMIPGNGLSWAVFSSAPTIKSNIPPTLVPTISMFSMNTFFPTAKPTLAPSSLRTITTQKPTNTVTPTVLPTLIPSIMPTISPTILRTAEPSISPTKILSTAPTFSPTSTGVGASSISSVSSSQTGTSNIAIGVGIGCLFLAIIMVCACIFFRNKKEKQTPYQVWTSYY